MVTDFMGDYCAVYECISQITPYVINSRAAGVGYPCWFVYQWAFGRHFFLIKKIKIIKSYWCREIKNTI